MPDSPPNPRTVAHARPVVPEGTLAAPHPALWAFALIVLTCVALADPVRAQQPQVVWDFALGKENTLHGTPVVGPDGTIYIGVQHKRLYALDPQGRLKWEWAAKGGVHTRPVLAGDGTIFVGHFDGGVAAISSSGVQRWALDIEIPQNSAAAAATDGGMYFVGYYARPRELKALENCLCSLNSRGELNWKFNLAQVYEGSVPVIDRRQNILILGSSEGSGRLYSISPTGALNWTRQGVSTDAGLGMAGEIHVGTLRHSLARLGPSGEILWETDLGDQPASSPVVDSAGNVYVGTQDGYLYSIRPDGRVRWTYESTAQSMVCGNLSPAERAVERARTRTRHPPLRWAPTLGPDGSIVLATGDSVLSMNSDGGIRFRFAAPVRTGVGIGPGPTYYFGTLATSGNWQLTAVRLFPEGVMTRPAHIAAPGVRTPHLQAPF